MWINIWKQKNRRAGDLLTYLLTYLLHGAGYCF